MALQDMKKDSGTAGVGTLNAFIDQGSEFSGKLSFKDTVRIDGKFDGEISSENTLIIGETGRIHATIQSETVIISGEVEGEILAPRQVTIHKTARVTGNIRTGSLAVEEGAELNGQITMTAQTQGTRPSRSKGKSNGVDTPGVPADL
jgi:cytoskeletal protein CcmA (bactofilin family)